MDWEKRERRRKIKKILRKILGIIIMISLLVFIVWFGKWYCGGTYQMKYYFVGATVTALCLLVSIYINDWFLD